VGLLVALKILEYSHDKFEVGEYQEGLGGGKTDKTQFRNNKSSMSLFLQKYS